ncbi:hypothetical protein O7632_04885 [Solwaraspora sp. WMMD406]|uniref:hypothetical protein n=1 Tax=Solwaraspora sp. WMMD406 TaxID=3016095 RepID=UPI0024178679|nr:hypothetical protein [Solwaraspora sp. WMMD406]MDG4763445.1 hypothetical protein [Solwaraspora sp. WMMD406]
MSEESSVEIRLTPDEALVLSDWIYRLEEQDDALNDEAVWVPLRRIAGVLDKALVAVFAPDYRKRIEAARMRLLAERGLDENSE